ncbi:MAG TPA: hypothetical protein PLV68_05105, partial [Ilumatobacteraceae bacterium]|nr:hypothetical protein [Ilumatobacteraceae bacterium]
MTAALTTTVAALLVDVARRNRRGHAIALTKRTGRNTELAKLGAAVGVTYATTSAPAAAIFAIMTKVGAYAIIRVSTLIFGAGAGPLA